MHKVEMMTQSPTTCLTCGRGNTPNDPDTMDEFWAIDMERDVNWGDSTYICRYCCDQLAAIAGFVTEGQLAEMTDLADGLRVQLHEKDAEFDSYRRRARAVLAGKKQEKVLTTEAREAAAQETSPKPKKKKQAKKAA